MPEPLRLMSLALHAVANDTKLCQQVERHGHRLPKLYRLGSLTVADAIEDLQHYNQTSFYLRKTFSELRSLLKDPQGFAYEIDLKIARFLIASQTHSLTENWVFNRIGKIYFSQSDYPRRSFDHKLDRELSILVEQLRHEAYITYGNDHGQKLSLMYHCAQWRADLVGEQSYQQLCDLRKEASCYPQHAILKFAMAVRQYFNLSVSQRQVTPLVVKPRVLRYLNWLTKQGDYAQF